MKKILTLFTFLVFPITSYAQQAGCTQYSLTIGCYVYPQAILNAFNNLPNGTTTTPALAFANASNTGILLDTSASGISGNLGIFFQINGSQVGEFQTGKLIIPGQVSTGTLVSSGQAFFQGPLTAQYSMGSVAHPATLPNTGLTVGWDYQTGQGEVDFFLGPQGGVPALNIYGLSGSGVVQQSASSPIWKLDDSGNTTQTGYVNTNQLYYNGLSRLLFSDQTPITPTSGFASTYLGLPDFNNQGSMRSDIAHYQMSGYTRGWTNGTCILAINANSPAGTTGCGQGGYYDMGYRTVYPGQDSDAVSFFINGITPVATNVAISSMSSIVLTNPAGQSETVGVMHLASALNSTQQSAINNSAGPMRVQINNNYFGYIIPQGFTNGSTPVLPIATDGVTIYVDNWTRSIQPTNTTAAAACPSVTAGIPAACPSFNYITNGATAVTGTGILPNTVGLTNGSSPLGSYTATIDVNYLAESEYNGFKITNNDVVSTARVIEMIGIVDKTGTPVWNEFEPLNDTLNGSPMTTQMVLAGCQNDNGSGIGTCGSFTEVLTGIKRGLVCDNAQNSSSGDTDCILDPQSTTGYHSTKTSGYVMFIEPGASGTATALIDYEGNANLPSLSTSTGGITINSTSAQPTCNSTDRGLIWLIKGTPDNMQICLQSSTSGVYTWVNISHS